MQKKVQKMEKNKQPFLPLDDNNDRTMKLPMSLKKHLFLLVLCGWAGFGLFFLNAQAQDASCNVTNPAGNFAEGTLLDRLTDPACNVITFNVPQIEPLTSLVEIRGGVTLTGGPNIVLQYDPDFAWPDLTYQECLLRIRPLPPAFSTQGVLVSNLTVVNPYGKGICVTTDGGRTIGQSRIQNVTVRSGAMGIDLGSSPSNLIENATIIAEGNGPSAGIVIGGLMNVVRGGRIEGFPTGIFYRDNSGLGAVSQVDFLKIERKPIDYPAGSAVAPADLRSAFVGAAQFSVTGVASELSTGIELYSVSTGAAGTDYEYKKTLTSADFVPLAPQNIPSRLTAARQRRFVRTLTPARDGIPAGSPLAVMANLWVPPFFSTPTEFSAVYDGANPVVGGFSCAAAPWFWWSYDAQTNQVQDPAFKGWGFDADGDGIDNSCLLNRCADSRLAEDLDRDCHVDVIESNPDDFFSQYDFDCDADSDHRLARGTADNCLLFLRPNAAPYTKEDRILTGCGDSAFNARNYRSFNPDQSDVDQDGIGDFCEQDIDNDLRADGVDNCPTVFNPDQRDSDGNGTGDACEQLPTGDPRRPANPPVQDADGDGVANLADNCPFFANADQKDTDKDKVGDTCDFDDDNDGLADLEETLGLTDAEARAQGVSRTDPLIPDTDNDGVCDGPGLGFDPKSCIRPLDNCPLAANREQGDRDEDGIGEPCDADPAQWLGEVDSDKDGINDIHDGCPTHRELVPGAWADSDGDSVGDACDPDDDNDGLDDVTESGMPDPRLRTLPGVQSRYQPDLDGDSAVDGVDVCPHYFNPLQENLDFQADLASLPDSNCGGYSPVDIDNDGVRNENDNCLFTPNTRQLDLDGDKKGDACDQDDDNDDNANTERDECLDYLAAQNGLLPISARNGIWCDPLVSENSGCRRTCDVDESANFRLHAWDSNSDHEGGRIFGFADQKCDGAGVGFGLEGGLNRCVSADPCPEFFNPPGEENCRPGLIAPSISPQDADGDGILNGTDNCSFIPNPDQSDLDNDSQGDLCDDDLDGDGLANVSDVCPAVANPDQIDTDKDGVGDLCDPNPSASDSAKIQGGGAPGCQLDGKWPEDIDFLWPFLAGIVLIGVSRRYTDFF